MAAAGSDHHVAVLLEDDVGAVVEVEHRDAVELGGGAAGLRHRVRVDKVHLWVQIMTQSSQQRRKTLGLGSFF